MRLISILIMTAAVLMTVAGCTQSRESPRPSPMITKYQLPLDLSAGQQYRFTFLRPKHSGWFVWEDPSGYRSLDRLRDNYLDAVVHGKVVSIEQSANRLIIQTLENNKIAYYSAVKRANGRIVPAVYGVYLAVVRKNTFPIKSILDWKTDSTDSRLTPPPIRCRTKNLLEGGVTIVNMIIPTCRR